MKKENGNFIALMLPIALQMRFSLILVLNEDDFVSGNFIALMLPIALQMRISLILVLNEE